MVDRCGYRLTTMKREHMLGLGCVIAGGVAAAASRQRKRHEGGHAIATRPAQTTAARSLKRSAAMFAGSVLVDSAIEHDRGSFTNPAMVVPLAVSVCSLYACLQRDRQRAAHGRKMRRAIHRTATGVGIVGTAFHCYNIAKRPGGWCWNNLFYAAPLGAPSALLLSGLLGSMAERLLEQPGTAPRLFCMPAWRSIALLSAAGLLGSSGEATLLHFRGSFQRKAMYAPVLLPPLAAMLLARTAISPTASTRWPARLALRLTALLGVVGSFFHIRGVARYHGGWRNWRQNLYCGPPVPAPPSFTALAITGQTALTLQKASA